MAWFFVNFGAKTMVNGRAYLRQEWKPKLLLNESIFFSNQFIQTPQFVHFNGLLPCPLKRSLSKVHSIQWPECEGSLIMWTCMRFM